MNERALEHPLPSGMRDLLPGEARQRRAIARRVLDRLALYGYEIVTLPAFEFADVLERGLGAMDPADVLRFIEPETGQVAALRPDMTPQIARVMATRLRSRPPPYRLSYEGTVLRRLGGRARKHTQIPQVGAELGGVAGPDGDLEVIEAAASALRGVGLDRFTIDLADAGIARALMANRSETVARALSRALSFKDEDALRDLGADDLAALVRLNGGRDALDEGAKRFANTTAAGPIARLTALFDAAAEKNLAPDLSVDLGEVRGFAYYTGMLFHAYAPGPGQALGGGGRYDDLLARFGTQLPAAGFAFDLDRLSSALETAGAAITDEPRILVAGDGMGDVAKALRARGLAVGTLPGEEGALEYARAWGHAVVLTASEMIVVSGTKRLSSPFGKNASVDPVQLVVNAAKGA